MRQGGGVQGCIPPCTSLYTSSFPCTRMLQCDKQEDAGGVDKSEKEECWRPDDSPQQTRIPSCQLVRHSMQMQNISEKHKSSNSFIINAVTKD